MFSNATRDAYLDNVGVTPEGLNVLLAVMSHERCFGLPVQRKEVADFLGVKDISITNLVRGRWLNVEGKVNGKLSATPRAWRELGFQREERRSA
jgi:hypothetical protein